ncbi:MAG: SulP family inorganic anion transporter [Chitinophagaceae bacterium]|nr:SulP family inorganic anion transporter [Chitinophagaceae bacterium]
MAANKSFFTYAKKDIVSGIIVFLIALPLCLGIAQASNAPLFSGIVAGIIGGIVVGMLSKSHVSVSGPAAGLVSIVVGALTELQAFEIFVCAVMLAGLFQLILGFIKAGTFANFFPSSVIEGMLAGIGLTIIFKQLPDAVGYSGPDHLVGMRDGERGMNYEILTGITDHIQLGALLITIIGIAILVLWQTKAMKKFQLIPAGLLVVLIGTFLNILFKATAGALHLNNEFLVQLNVPASASDFFAQFSLPDFNGFLNPKVWQFGAIIAVVASIETLLCIEATDKLDPMKRNTSGNAELKAQGIGNMLSGLIGGLPITSVIVRSSANINAGAKSKLSAIFHGVLLLTCVASIPAILNYIPKSALAAILIFTGFRLARPALFRHMYKVGPTEFIPFVVTAIAVALPFLGLLKGVAIGFVINIFYLLRANMRIPYYYKRVQSDNGDITRLELAQEVSFLNKGSIKETLGSVADGSTIIIDASKSEYIDYDVLEEIRDFHDVQAPDRNITVSLVGFKNDYKIPQGSNVHYQMMDELATDKGAKTSVGKHKKLLKELNENKVSNSDE